MLYNLRSDIIYYKSGSDFELEFNLCGCCRMRLLTDKPSNKKTFVHSLARAVSRSRVILIAGPLFGEENTIEIVAQALGTSTETVNNAAYSIASDDEIEIIKGSLPLVSSDGSFGGCIIERGPQTMILLTDNKTLRKSIMSNLIHPYISELYTAEMQGVSKSEQTVPTTEVADDNAGEIIVEDPAPQVEKTEETSTETTENTSDEYSLVLGSDDENSNYDITADDIFIEPSDDEPEEEYVKQNDITIDDLFPSSPELAEPARTIDEKLSEVDIVLEHDEYVCDDLPEEYKNAYDNLFINNEKEDEDFHNLPPIADEYEFLNDNGEIVDEEEIDYETRKSGLSIATVIFTVILLLSIITLCICIFTASTSEGMAPSEYIQSVWQTLFG